MAQRTFEIEIEDCVNLRAALADAGFDEANILRQFSLVNNNSEPVYIHLTGSAEDEPDSGDAAKGIAVGTSEPSTERNESFIDPNTTWLYAANAVDVKILVITGG